MCDAALKAGLVLGIDPACPTGTQADPSSVSDRVCRPNTTVVGYMGGVAAYPTYENYTTGDNYSETLRLEYDPETVSYDDILAAFWRHAGDPTIPQPDPAYQLRIFANSPAQRTAAEASLAAQKQVVQGDVLCNIYDAADYTFWKAEEYHQQYAFGGSCGSGAAAALAGRCAAARAART